MQVSHTARALSASFDDPNLVSAAGLVPAMALALAVEMGLGSLVDQWVKLPGYFGANAGLKVTALVAGMLAGADSIDLCRLRDYADAGCACERDRCAGGLLGRWPLLRFGIITGLQGRQAAGRSVGNGPVATE